MFCSFHIGHSFFDDAINSNDTGNKYTTKNRNFQTNRVLFSAEGITEVNREPEN